MAVPVRVRLPVPYFVLLLGKEDVMSKECKCFIKVGSGSRICAKCGRFLKGDWYIGSRNFVCVFFEGLVALVLFVVIMGFL